MPFRTRFRHALIIVERFQRSAAFILAIFFFVLFWIVDIPDAKPAASRTLGITIAMVVLWVTKAVPMGATALLPAVLFPITGVMSGSQTANQYINQQSMVFIGGFVLALAMERWDLHKRIALKTMLLFGNSLTLMFMSFTLVTYFLSMWISNTATTLIMIPNAIGIVSRLENIIGVQAVAPFAIALYLGIAFSSSIGGISTIIGTPTNLLFIQIFSKLFPTAPEVSFFRWMLFALPCSLALLVFMLVYFYLLYVRKTSRALNTWLLSHATSNETLRDNLEDQVSSSISSNLNTNANEGSDRPLAVERANNEGNSFFNLKDFFRQEYAKLGPVKFEEIVILIMFSLLALLWITRASIGPVPGWNTLFPNASYVGDGTPAVLIAILLFIVPARNIPPHVPHASSHADPTKPSSSTGHTGSLRNRNNRNIPNQSGDDDTNAEGTPPTPDPIRSSSANHIMDWGFMKNFPWEIIILFGGGFALAEGFRVSGLSDVVGQKLSVFQEWPSFVLLLTICAVTTFLTEITSNMVVAQIFIPIVGSMCVKLGICPLYLMIPATISCSYAFMLPIATAPNMIVFVSNRITVKQMASTGLLLNFAAVAVTSLCSLALLPVVYEFDINTLPDWAKPLPPSNATMPSLSGSVWNMP